MSESKVRNMQLIVEREYSSENPKIRIYLSEMQKSRFSKVKEIFQTLLGVTCKGLLTTTLVFPFGIGIVKLAYLERGYQAYGGEYLLIAFIFGMTYKMLQDAIRAERKKNGHEKRRVGRMVSDKNK